MTGKRIEDMDAREAREIGEQLYADVRGSYTVAGTLIAVTDRGAVSLGDFAEGTFHISPEGKVIAIERGLLPPEPELQHPEEPVFGVPETPADLEGDPSALPSDVPVRDPEPHPSQPIANAPDVLSHRITDPTGAVDENTPFVEGEEPISAGTLPDMVFSQPPEPPEEPVEGEEPEEPGEALIIKRPIAESFASEGGGTPEHPIRPRGVLQAETPDPNAPPPDVIDNTLPPEGTPASTGRKGRNHKLGLKDEVKAEADAKSS